MPKWVIVLIFVAWTFVSVQLGRMTGYSQGSYEGEQEGFKEGYTHFMSSMIWQVNPERHQKFVKEYGSIKLTPWDEFIIEEKMLLCVFGSPGNRLDCKDMKDMQSQYHNECGDCITGVDIERNEFFEDNPV